MPFATRVSMRTELGSEQYLYTNITRTASCTFIVFDILSDSVCDPPDPEQFNYPTSISSPLAASLSTVHPLSTTRTSLTQFRCQITVLWSQTGKQAVCVAV